MQWPEVVHWLIGYIACTDEATKTNNYDGQYRTEKHDCQGAIADENQEWVKI